jgi:hypothetical protein
MFDNNAVADHYSHGELNGDSSIAIESPILHRSADCSDVRRRY